MSEYIYGQDDGSENSINKEGNVGAAENGSASEPTPEAQPQAAQPQQPQPQEVQPQSSPEQNAAPEQPPVRQQTPPRPVQTPQQRVNPPQPPYRPQGTSYQYNPYYGSDNGGYGRYGYGQPQPPQPPTPPQPPKKKKGGKGPIIAAVVLLAVVMIATTLAVGAAYMSYSEDLGGTDTDAGQPIGTGDTPGTAAPDDTRERPDLTLAPDSLGTKDKGTIANVVKNVADSVVEIVTEYATKESFWYSAGAGSGVIVSEDGYIITNNHVIYDDDLGIASTITVTLTNGDSYKAELYGRDQDSDIAIIKIDAEGLTPAVIGSSGSLVVGEEVVIIGNPLGTLGGSVTNGIISALDREITVGDETMNLLQTNAAVNPGNSGGGMFNMAGELVGIVNAKYSDTGIEGLAFAIPIDDAAVVANEILEYGYVRGRADLRFDPVVIESYEDMIRYRVRSLGVYVLSAEEGYNDDVLQRGDRIYIVDGVEISDYASLRSVLKRHSVGDKLDAIIIRDGREVEVTLECFERTPEIAFGSDS